MDILPVILLIIIVFQRRDIQESIDNMDQALELIADMNAQLREIKAVETDRSYWESLENKDG